MSKVIIYEGNNGLSVVSPASHLNIHSVAKDVVPVNTEYRVVDSSQLPADKTFRAAWNIKCEVDIKKAKAIWANKMRVVRDAKLKELDIKWMKAMENEEKKVASSIAAEKQILRDVTEREDFRRLKTVDQIKRFWPEALEG